MRGLGRGKKRRKGTRGEGKVDGYSVQAQKEDGHGCEEENEGFRMLFCRLSYDLEASSCGRLKKSSL